MAKNGRNLEIILALKYEDHVPWILKMKEWILRERNIFVTIQRKLDEMRASNKGK